MTTYAVRYTYDARSDVRDAVRPEHRAYLGGLLERGALHMSGPFSDEGEPGALLIFEAAGAEELAELLAADPFAREGLVARIDVRAWTVAIGSLG
ncbi:YciI family protein [Cellulomonas alba]|uniref:YciI family protein n=1 Tax=Cellulomonas alba TaxID=3053467 RepID=A0ABT7SJH9_9CELL|nr:YciI family protein [Cellulomonas alba]MDM7856335.1 YciI family protein [Cellulomonas alba]